MSEYAQGETADFVRIRFVFGEGYTPTTAQPFHSAEWTSNGLYCRNTSDDLLFFPWNRIHSVQIEEGRKVG